MKFAYSTFSDLWRSIIKNETERNYDKSINNSIHLEEDMFFNDLPVSQEFLTHSYMIFYKKIEYTNFTPLLPDKANNKNLFDCFHGILFYIYYYSENKLNVEEIEIHFSGAKFRKNLALMTNQNQIRDQYDILTIFDYENINKQFKIDCVKNAFFGLTFKRIKIRPTSYSIRSGVLQNNISHLVSFTFEGFDEEKQQWDVLDERVNINELIPSGGFNMFFVHFTTKSYSSFKIKQIDPGSNGFWGFSIAAFDVHGFVSLREKSYVSNNIFMENNLNLFSEIEYNPIMDMSDFIF